MGFRGFGNLILSPIENPIGQIGIANLTGYSLATAYSLASGLCQEILRERPMYGKTEAAPRGNMEKRITLYCNDLIGQILDPNRAVAGQISLSRGGNCVSM